MVLKNKDMADTDMMRSKFALSQKKRQRQTFFLLIVSLLCAIAAFYWFWTTNYYRILSQNRNYIEDYTIQMTRQTERILTNAQALVVNAANQYAQLLKTQPDMSSEEMLEIIQDNHIFSRISYVSPEGFDIGSGGKIQVSDMEYFQQGIQGKTGWQALEESQVTHESVIVFYAPIKVEGEIVGVMSGHYNKERLRVLFSDRLFNYSPHTYLFQKDGEVIASSETALKDGNIVKGLSMENFQGSFSYQNILEFLDNPDQTYISFGFGKSGHTSVGSIVKSGDESWMILIVMPDSVTSGMVLAANQTGIILEIILVLVFLSYMYVVLSSFRHQEKHLQYLVETATENLNQTVKEERKQQAIISSLAGIYIYAYYFDMGTLEYGAIRRTGNYATIIPEQGDITDVLQLYLEQLILPDSISEMQEFLDLSTLGERLSHTEMITMEYQRQDANWCRACFVVAERDPNGQPKTIILASQFIESEKIKELETQAALHDAYEAAQLANHAKTTFLSNMSHDMRTPMNAIIGMTAIAGAHLDDKERVMECLGKIISSSRHLLALINEVLDMSKIESGKVELNEEDFSLSDLVENMLTLNHSLIAERHHSVVVNLHNLVHEHVVGDNVRLQQVFTNLLSNAAKYTPDGGLIQIDLTEKLTTNNNVGLYEAVFQDNGIGMSSKFLEHLFEPFVRADDKWVGNVQGTGLGMSIARNIIRMMGGEITVESELGKGTKFVVTFYLKLQQDSEYFEEKFLGLSVLVADDDQEACESTCAILDSLGMKSEWVLSGEEAVSKVCEVYDGGGSYYAVILDWKMPGIGGINATKAIRERVGEKVPIIIISAYDWQEIEQEARAAGANEFIGKPLFASRVIRLFNGLMGEETKAEEKTLKDVMNQYDFTGKRVLLVEDNELNTEIAVEILEMAGLQVETAQNGKIAVEMVKASSTGYYDLVLMDIQMPVMDGHEATRMIRKLDHPDAKTLPVVAMTANAFASDVQAAHDAGMNGHIAKPLDFNHLVKVLIKYLKPSLADDESI